jgi:hypothetical protein
MNELTASSNFPRYASIRYATQNLLTQCVVPRFVSSCSAILNMNDCGFTHFYLVCKNTDEYYSDGRESLRKCVRFQIKRWVTALSSFTYLYRLASLNNQVVASNEMFEKQATIFIHIIRPITSNTCLQLDGTHRRVVCRLDKH